MAHRFLVLLAVATLVPSTALARLQAATPTVATPAAAPATAPASRGQEIFVTTRDGTRLAANLFLPEGKGPWPVIVTRTPYLKDGPIYPPQSALRFTRAGYAYVVQDVRGKGKSEGRWNLYATSIEDGFDTVEAIAKLPWSNGRIGITGGSAMGINAEMAALGQPPHLKAAFLSIAPKDVFDYLFPGGVPKGRDLTDFFHSSGYDDDAIRLIRTRQRDNVILKRWGLGEDADFVDIPIWHLGGWYDIFNSGSTDSFTALQDHGGPDARGRQRLTMGPFAHADIVGDLSYPGVERVDEVLDPKGRDGPEIRWFDHWLKGIDNGVTREKPVEVFMMAAARKGAYSPKNRWIHFDRWPAPHTTVRYYLNADLGLAPSPPKAADRTLTYAADPANPVTSFGGSNLFGARGAYDQRQIGRRPDYLRFSTPVLTQDVAIAGKVEVELFAATDAPSTDFVAKLVDVYPDGYEALVLDNPVRIRAGESAPGRPRKLTIDLWSTAITFEKGHRIEVHIASSSSPRFEVNHNNGDTALAPAPGRIAHNTLYLDHAHPSALVLPVVPADLD